MKDKRESKSAHPMHQGAGMPYFEKDHWQKKVQDIELADGKYSSEMNQEEEYRKSVDALSNYAKRHKMQY